MSSESPIYVTQPTLPPLEEFVSALEQIWQRRILTNGGPFHQQLEKDLCDFLGVKHISLFANATLGLVTALQTLRVTGEVITTPYSFVATAHSLLWNGVKPVFVDIDPQTLNLDPAKIEAAITPHTTAIMPVHCYGRPCDVDAIQRVADIYNLKVIYDAAHAFGVSCHCGSVLNHGDLSIISFHATKVFNTFEGGAIVSPDEKSKRRIDHLKNFGFVDEITVVAPGMNGKMSEVSAAMGVLQLKYVNQALSTRRIVDERYRANLSNCRGLTIPPSFQGGNYSYFPILVNESARVTRDEVYDELRKLNVFARRYFYPLISDFPMYRTLASARPANLPVATKIASQVLCLPIYPALKFEDVDRICAIIMELV